MRVTDWAELSIELQRLAKERDDLLNRNKYEDAIKIQYRIIALDLKLVAWMKIKDKR